MKSTIAWDKKKGGKKSKKKKYYSLLFLHTHTEHIYTASTSLTYNKQNTKQCFPRAVTFRS